MGVLPWRLWPPDRQTFGLIRKTNHWKIQHFATLPMSQFFIFFLLAWLLQLAFRLFIMTPNSTGSESIGAAPGGTNTKSVRVVDWMTNHLPIVAGTSKSNARQAIWTSLGRFHTFGANGIFFVFLCLVRSVYKHFVWKYWKHLVWLYCVVVEFLANHSRVLEQNHYFRSHNEFSSARGTFGASLIGILLNDIRW